jgi:hypothetical protein
MSDSNTEITGRKVFFLHPSAFVQNTILEPLVQQEFEIYQIKDEAKIPKILKKYPDSIVFACIDEVLTPKQWEEWVIQHRATPSDNEMELGILSNTNNEDTRKLYVETLKVPCGFISLKPDKDKAIKALIEALNTLKAKGRRKYVRADTQHEAMTTINLPIGDSFVTGEIRDISVVGLSCTFSKELNVNKNAIFHDIQLKLQSALVKVEGILFGSRTEEGEVPQIIYVFLFAPKTDAAIKAKIRTFIQKRIQALMDVEILTMT